MYLARIKSWGRMFLIIFAIPHSLLAEWTETQKLVASDYEAFQSFGRSVDHTNLTAIVGSSDDIYGESSGSAYIFLYENETWVQSSQLIPDEGNAHDGFGISVAISDNNIAVVGAHRADIESVVDAGAAYIFEKVDDTWSQQTKLIASDYQESECFGVSTCISNNIVAIGAYQADISGKVDVGAVYIFEYSNGTWTQVEKIISPDGEAGDHFGRSVDISGDRIIIGAPSHDSQGMVSSGAAYFYEKLNNSWNFSVKLVAGDVKGGADFGYDVSISGDNALIGATGAYTGIIKSGAAYVFEFDGSEWSQTNKLVASDAANDDYFGKSVDITNTTAIVGADWADPDEKYSAGAAYIFESNGEDWSQTTKLTASDGTEYDRFGDAVSMFENIAMVGAFCADHQGTTYTGAAYVFENDDPISTLLTTFYAETHSNQIDLFWQSAQETNIAGYHVLCGTQKLDLFERITSELIRAQGANSRYRFSHTPPDITSCQYKLEIVYLDGSTMFTEPISVNITSGITTQDVPTHAVLYPNYPNPCNPHTIIPYELPVTNWIKIRIFDATGRFIKTLIDRQMPAGTHTVSWDGTNKFGQPVANGSYIYELRTAEHAIVRKITMLK